MVLGITSARAVDSLITAATIPAILAYDGYKSNERGEKTVWKPVLEWWVDVSMLMRHHGKTRRVCSLAPLHWSLFVRLGCDRFWPHVLS
jgi:hypothetical protein